MDLLGTANRAMRHYLVLRGVESHTTRVGPLALHYYRRAGTGLGPPVLLIHGLGSSANAYARMLAPLSRRFRHVFAVDIPGNGFSPLPDSGPVPLREQVTAVVGFIEQVVKEPVFLVGNSLGGAMSLFLAHERPDLVRALGLIAPAGAKLAPERIEALLASFKLSSNKEARAITRRLFHRTPVSLLILSSEMRRLYSTPTVQSIVNEVKPSDAVTEDMLRALAMPTLLLWGRSERLLPYESVDYFRAHLPSHAQVHEVPGFGHIPQFEKPSEVAQRLISFADAQAL